MRPRSVMPQDRPAQPTHPSWHPRSGLTGTHGTGGSRRWQGQGRRGGEARACSLRSRTVPRALNDRAQGLDVVDLSVAQILALMEARGIEAAQLAAVSSKQEQLAACFANDRQASARWRDHRLVDARERHPAQRGPHPCGFVRGTRSSSGRELPEDGMQLRAHERLAPSAGLAPSRSTWGLNPADAGPLFTLLTEAVTLTHTYLLTLLD